MSVILILTGAPGAGKGTQADLIAHRLGFKKFSTGDVLRKHIKMGTEIGKKAETIIVGGNLVPDDILFTIVKNELDLYKPDDKVLLDGYPRTVKQAYDLQSLSQNHPVKMVIQLDVNKQNLTERLSGRRVCSQCGKSFHIKFNPSNKGESCDVCGGLLEQRADDYPDKIAVRLSVYENETKPVIDFYKNQGVFTLIDGNGTTEQIYKRLESIIKTLY